MLGVPEIDDPVVHSRDAISDAEGDNKPISKADQTARKSHSIPDKKLVEETEIRPDYIAAFEYQPIGSNKDPKSGDDSRDNALDRGVESQKPRQYHLL